MFKKICDIASESIVVTDKDAHIIYVNDAFCKLTGYSHEELLGQNPRILKSGVQDNQVYQDMWDTLNRGETWHGEFANRKKNGSIYWENAIITVFKHDGNAYYLGVKEDITALKRLEEQVGNLRRLEEKTHDLQKQVDDLMNAIKEY